MLNNTTDSRVLHTKQCLLEALILLLKEKPFEDISIKQITDKAGVSRPTFYSHYNKKEDVIIEYVQHFLDLIYNDLKDETDLAVINEKTSFYLHTHEAFITAILQANLDYLLLRQIELFFKRCIPTLFSPNPTLLSKMDLELSAISHDDIATFLAAGIYSIAKKVIYTKDYSHIEHYTKLFTLATKTISETKF